MADSSPAFVSVKLAATLVDQARASAQTMRRSVASQIEYWATLGKALEQAGLTTSDSHALIARQERAVYGAALPGLTRELDEIHGHVVALAKSGALNARVQEAVFPKGPGGVEEAYASPGASQVGKPARRPRKAP